MNDGVLEKAGWTVAQFAFDHPIIAGAIFSFAALSFVSSMVVSGIRYRYPVYAEMPSGTKFLLGFLMPLALNFWTLGKKVGIPEPEAPKQ